VSQVEIISNAKVIDLPIFLLNVAALPREKLVTGSFENFRQCFLRYVGSSEMSRFLVLDEDIDLEMDLYCR